MEDLCTHVYILGVIIKCSIFSMISCSMPQHAIPCQEAVKKNLLENFDEAAEARVLQSRSLKAAHPPCWHQGTSADASPDANNSKPEPCVPDLKPVAIKVEPGVVQPSASEPWGQQGVGWEWEGQRSGSATSNKEWEWDAGYGSEYGRGQWGYWYSSQNNPDQWYGAAKDTGAGWDGSWKGSSASWAQDSWSDKSWANKAWENGNSWRQTSWGNAIMRPGTCDLFDCVTPKKASPGTSPKKPPTTTPQTPQEPKGQEGQAADEAKELQKKHHAKYMRFYRSLDSLVLKFHVLTFMLR